MKKINEQGIPLPKIPQKMRRMMRATFIFALALAICSFTGLNAQKTELTLDLRDVPIKKVLQEIEAQTDFSFIYETAKIDLDKKVTLKVTARPVEEVLRQLFGKEGIGYTITDKNLIIVNPRGNAQGMQQPASHPVQGQVADTGGTGIPGVSVLVKGTSLGPLPMQMVSICWSMCLPTPRWCSALSACR